LSSIDINSLSLLPELVAVMKELNFQTFTAVQSECIPILLKGEDLVGQSKTGSGKTLAFTVPILQKINLETRDIQALILCPTRELCAQVAREIRKLGRKFSGLQVLILAGGEPSRPQTEALYKGAHIIVGTPGRVLDHLNRGRLDLHRINTLVLDEADRMLDMGFQEDMEIIIDAVPTSRQTVFFSATFPASIKDLSRRYQKNPKEIVIESSPDSAPDIEQWVIETSAEQKASNLLNLLKQESSGPAIVFCNLKVTVAELAESLSKVGFSATGLHGDLEQDDRNKVLAKFRNGSIRILVATDVAARGLDIEDLPLVVNYDLPYELDSYVHRIGRTGRAGKKGKAVSFMAYGEELKLNHIERAVGLKFSKMDVRLGKSEVPEGAQMETLQISAGRKEKMRPGDILGALTGEAGQLQASDIGKIEIHDHYSFVAVSRHLAPLAMERLREGRIKGRKLFIHIVK
jgi:ATP-independent RNA helicase DbpA